MEIPSVLAGYLLRLAHKDRELYETMDFVIKQILNIQSTVEGGPAHTFAQGVAFPLEKLVSGGGEDETMYEVGATGKMVPVADRSMWTEPMIVADQGAYNLGLRYYNRVSTDATRSIHGILPSMNGRRAIIVYVGVNRVILTHENAGAADPTYRILCVGSANITLLPNDMAFIWRDNLSARWRACKL